MSACNVGLHHRCDGQACGCDCNHIGVPAPVPATDHVALKTKNVCIQHQTDGCDATNSKMATTIFNGFWMCLECAQWFESNLIDAGSFVSRDFAGDDYY
jgi:hypothetical protein